MLWTNSLTIAKTINFYKNRQSVRKLLKKIEEMVQNGDGNAFRKLERKISLISKSYALTTVVAITSMIFPTILDILNNRPFKNPFSTEYGLGVEYEMILNILAFFEYFCHMLMGLSHVAIDVFLWGICLYIAQFFIDFTRFMRTNVQNSKKGIPLKTIWYKHLNLLR